MRLRVAAMNISSQELSQAHEREPQRQPRYSGAGSGPAMPAGLENDVAEADTGVDSETSRRSCWRLRRACPKDFTSIQNSETAFSAACRWLGASSLWTGLPAEALAFATLAAEGIRVRLTRTGFGARNVQPSSRRPA